MDSTLVRILEKLDMGLISVAEADAQIHDYFRELYYDKYEIAHLAVKFRQMCVTDSLADCVNLAKNLVEAC